MTFQDTLSRRLVTTNVTIQWATEEFVNLETDLPEGL